METLEIWKDIPWYEWQYKASNFWRIKSLYFKNKNSIVIRDLILKPFIKRKYLYIKIRKKHITIGRLIWCTFLWLNLNDRWTLVCHKDDNPNNNTLENLFLWTSKENTQDMISKWRCRSGEYWIKTVFQFTLDNKFIKKWISWSFAGRTLWIKQWNISKCCTWNSKTAGGYIWKY